MQRILWYTSCDTDLILDRGYGKIILSKKSKICGGQQGKKMQKWGSV